jgi:adenylate kinase family enzyme
MNRILIVGRGSAGKSTFAKALGKKLSLPVYHLDQHFWKAGWEHHEDIHAIHSKLIAKDKWIIEGSTEYLEERAERADLCIVLALPPHKTIPNWLGRLWKYRGVSRPDIAKGNVEKFNLEYIRWQLDWKSNKRKIKRLRAVCPAQKLIILKSRKQFKKYLAGL